MINLQKQTDLNELHDLGEERSAKSVAAKMRLPYVNLNRLNIKPEIAGLVNEKDSRIGQFIVFERKQNNLKIAIVDPRLSETEIGLNKLKEQGYTLFLHIASKEGLEKSFKAYTLYVPPKISLVGKIDISATQGLDLKSIANLPKDFLTPTDLLNLILKTAINLQASDIHLELSEDKLTLRYRLDGLLYDGGEIEKRLGQKLIDRFKLLAGLKLNILAKTQDGRFTIADGQNNLEVRVSALPGNWGENIVMRLLSPDKIALKLNDLGFRGWEFNKIKTAFSAPNGLILATGPTGSGKTTTLYAALKEKINPNLKIISIEDPIEYHLKGINQTQIDKSKNYNFANGLASILRQDPEVILIGEIRDNETAEIAAQAALTGHLVLSTLHANEAAGAIPRLLELAVNETAIASSLKLVIGQRLIRKLCPYCKQPYDLDKQTSQKIRESFSILSANAHVSLPEKLPQFYKAVGCERCQGSGYSGQIGLFENFFVSGPINEAITKDSSLDHLRQLAIEEGMVPLFHDGVLKALDGATSLEEVYRVAGDIAYIEGLYGTIVSSALRRGLFLEQSHLDKIQAIPFKELNLTKIIADLEPLAKLSYIIATAIIRQATDINCQIEKDTAQIYLREEGGLTLLCQLNDSDYFRLVSSLKSITGLPLKEGGEILEGRFKVNLPSEKTTDIRVSIIPGGYGPVVSLRLLSGESQMLGLENLGILPELIPVLSEAIKKPQGLILAAGPTSSGKTTTLFALLQKVKRPDIKIVTIEDPIEYNVEGIVQTQIDESKGYSFEKALRGMMRQNPNIILIGEIRDAKTAKVAIQASLTGHLVFSTIHSLNAVGAIERLISFGIAPQDLSAINLIISQRLTKRLCSNCSQDITADKTQNSLIDKILLTFPNKWQSSFKKLLEKPYSLKRPIGCSDCAGDGYNGLTGIFELAFLTDAFASLTIPDLTKKIAKETISLKQDATLKLLRGVIDWQNFEKLE
jgi:type IV pilus assembly protein PilB